jgi:glycerol-3-phosphate O-acyltransferase/dihydroxyacetone phosphate acyltransferase
VSRTHRILLWYCRSLLRIFFRRIEIAGLENLPEEGGGLLVSWHPNGAIDGTVLFSKCPRPVVFGARHGLLKMPILGWMLRQCGTVPLYRAQDAADGESEEQRRARNRRSVDALARAIGEGGFAALFPEGRSHDEPFVHELKTGAAHLYYRAHELTPAGNPPPVIIPVALHYNKKAIWGSQVLVTFHPPLKLPDELAIPAEDDEERRYQARQLTTEFDRVLHEVILATESWDLHHLLHRVRKLLRAEGHARQGLRSQPSDIVERVRQFGRIWRNYDVARRTHPVETRKLLDGVEFYDGCLSALQIEDYELDGATWKVSPLRTALLVIELLVVYLLLPFFLLIGILVNLPTMLLLQGIAKTASSKYKDEASIKLMVGAVLFPLTWLVAAILVAWGGSTLAAAYPEIPYSSLLTAVVAFVLSAFGGLLVLHFRQLATELARTLRVRLTLTRRHHAVEWLLEERGSLFDRFLALDRQLGKR